MRFLSGLLALSGLAVALPPRKDVDMSIVRRQEAAAYEYHTIDQPIDHYPHSDRYKPHTKDTFKQRYVFDATYYKPGGPVYLYIGGETDLASRFSNLETGIIQILMEATNGLGVILENRYYGESYPYNTSTTDELAYLTTEQTIADNAYFAQHAVFPGVNGSLLAPDTPWILYGGSLAGAQTAFSIKAHGDVLYGGIASSGVIHAVLAYPQWYDPIQKFGPSDCIASINGIIDKMDQLVQAKNTKAIQELKEIFGLGDLTDIRDFAMTIAFPIGGPMNYPTGTWQELIWYPAYSSDDFWNFCSNVTNIDAPESITSVDYKLAPYTGGEPWTDLGKYADYVKKVIVPLCLSGRIDSTDPGCFSTQNETFYADVTNSAARSYLYSTCTEQGAYQVAPAHGPSLISRVLQVDYTQEWCTWAFPHGKFNSIPPTPNLDYYNHYGGFNFKADRLAFIDGNSDVWLDVCYHSNDAPPRISSDLHPEYLIMPGGHHWDSYGIKNITAEPQFIREAHLWEIRTVKKWLASRK
ncbi:extracelular serine carboxypeptidase-like protein [Lophium mytilinum]|uniref:Extracelular serine carboxypeptidase-like protein n=1 Tax=Lophium mytilinum TaxID=390894 RepID=A0A6A6RC53_9PEZI|nr:extracelular serine carboxypeptidase-like protein [Lophium mytilinum]